MSEKKIKLPSLRSRYLTLASLIIFLLLIGASLANWYINEVSRDNASALAVSKKVTSTVSTLRDSLSRINLSVNTMLIRPEASQITIIDENLSHLFIILNRLRATPEIEVVALKNNIEILHRNIISLDEKIRFLIKQRNDPEWVYPILPYISKKLLIPNRNFLVAAEQAINEYLHDDIPADETYHQLQNIRYLWQSKIMNFRAVMVRFAGLNNISRTPQEIKIGELHEQIESILARLKNKQQKNQLEFQTEESLNMMINASSTWNQHWEEVQKIRTSTYWRGDIAYLRQQITPLQKSTNSIMRDLEATVQTWSNSQTVKLSDAAKRISTELWILVVLAIIFVVAVYIMIEKLVLRPTASIARSLTEDSQEEFFNLEDTSSQEIFQLTSSFNNMRKQIHQRQMALEHQALHDSLTGLPNRSLLNDRLTQAINIMHRNDDQLAVLLLDLDRFKEVNDTLGHHVGDQLLQLVSNRLENTIRNSDTVARLGGDEFAVIAPSTSAGEASKFAKKIISALNDVFTIDHQNIYVGASLGISIYPHNGTDIHTLLRHADIAMYIAKENNRDIVIYESSYDKNTPDNLSLAGDLHHAISSNDELQIYYQPQINLLSREINQVEALLRWQHPLKDFISPEEIIQLAEQTGMIKDLSYWVLDTSMHDYMQHLHKRSMGLSINLSAWNLQDPDLVGTIHDLLTRHQMPAEKLTLEITETAMMNDPVRARMVLNQLHDMNIILSIDDYGTGFSSLSYLKLLPVQELKIDKSFILDMLDDENDSIIVKSTIELAHNLGFKVVAEGVENNETLLQLRTQKCDFIQGYYLSKPMDIYQLIIWLNNYNPQIAL